MSFASAYLNHLSPGCSSFGLLQWPATPHGLEGDSDLPLFFLAAHHQFPAPLPSKFHNLTARLVAHNLTWSEMPFLLVGLVQDLEVSAYDVLTRNAMTSLAITFRFHGQEVMKQSHCSMVYCTAVVLPTGSVGAHPVMPTVVCHSSPGSCNPEFGNFWL